MTKKIRFKVALKCYGGTRRCPILMNTHVTGVSWDDSKGAQPYTVKKLGYARVDRRTNQAVAEPQSFSKIAAERVAEQVVRWRFIGPGPDGLAVATVEPIVDKMMR